MGNLTYNLNFEMLCTKYSLSQLMHEPEQITGGLLHRMYRLQTDQAVYAVKALNPQIMKRETAMNNYIRSEKVVNKAYQHGINAVPAIVSDGRFMHEVEGQYFLLFPWVHGKALPAGAVDMECCVRIGEVLAKLHQIDFTELKNDQSKESLITSVANWEALALQGKEEGMEWSGLLLDHLDKLEEWESRVQAAAKRLSNHTIISHRDLDPKNVLWDEQNVPIIIDWEAAGPIHPTLELLDVALYWSTLQSGGVSEAAFCAIIHTYVSQGGEIQADWLDVLHYGFLGKLEWLAYNIRRSLGLESTDDAERELGSREVTGTIMALDGYAGFIPQCMKLLQDNF